MDNVIYVFFAGLAFVFVSFVWFYFHLRKKKRNIVENKTNVSINYGLSSAEQSRYIEAAKRCQKDNSPISGSPFSELFAEGSEMLKKESFKLNDYTF